MMILLADVVRRAETHHGAKYSSKLVTPCGDVVISRFFMAATIYFRICKILLTDGVQRAESHYHAEFCQNWSIRCRDID